MSVGRCELHWDPSQTASLEVGSARAAGFTSPESQASAFVGIHTFCLGGVGQEQRKAGCEALWSSVSTMVC